MPRVSGPLNPVDDHARNPPWAAVARHDDVNRGAGSAVRPNNAAAV